MIPHILLPPTCFSSTFETILHQCLTSCLAKPLKSMNPNKHAVSKTMSTCPPSICLETNSAFDAQSTAIVGACLYHSRFVILYIHSSGPRFSASLNCKAVNCLRGVTVASLHNLPGIGIRNRSETRELSQRFGQNTTKGQGIPPSFTL
jgi:hypothetical protein